MVDADELRKTARVELHRHKTKNRTRAAEIHFEQTAAVPVGQARRAVEDKVA